MADLLQQGYTDTWVTSPRTFISEAISKTCSQLTPDLWKDHPAFIKSPYQEFVDHLHLLKAHQSPCAQGLIRIHIHFFVAAAVLFLRQTLLHPRLSLN